MLPGLELFSFCVPCLIVNLQGAYQQDQKTIDAKISAFGYWQYNALSHMLSHLKNISSGVQKICLYNFHFKHIINTSKSS